MHKIYFKAYTLNTIKYNTEIFINQEAGHTATAIFLIPGSLWFILTIQSNIWFPVNINRLVLVQTWKKRTNFNPKSNFMSGILLVKASKGFCNMDCINFSYFFQVWIGQTNCPMHLISCNLNSEWQVSESCLTFYVYIPVYWLWYLIVNTTKGSQRTGNFLEIAIWQMNWLQLM